MSPSAGEGDKMKAEEFYREYHTKLHLVAALPWILDALTSLILNGVISWTALFAVPWISLLWMELYDSHPPGYGA